MVACELRESETISVGLARRFYADEVCLAAGIRNADVWRAFATVPKERFFGHGPWMTGQADLIRGFIYTATDDDNACHLYHNVSVALDESRHLVSGQPSALARFFDELGVKPGSRVLHLGSGAGYYTAVLAEIVGPEGAVVATEADPALAGTAQANLAEYPWVTVHPGPGFPECSGPFDGILMNAGVTHFETAWLDNLSDGGRLLAPLTTPVNATISSGFVVKVTRAGGGFSLQPVAPTAIYSAIGLRDPAMEPAVRQLLATGALFRASVVRRDVHVPNGGCVLHRDGACLSVPVAGMGGGLASSGGAGSCL